jgi:outer membrane protein assembly factor BamB
MRKLRTTYKLLAVLICASAFIVSVFGPFELNTLGGDAGIYLSNRIAVAAQAETLQQPASAILRQTAGITFSNRLFLPVLVNSKPASPTPTPTPRPSRTPTPTATPTLTLTPIPNPGSTVGWPMAGANPQRTSWTSEQVPSAAYMAAHRNEWGNGLLYPQWYKLFDAYIPHNVQVIGANGLLYISTSRGLYAIDSNTGDLRWVYPTEMPLGHSPTITGGIAYVGGFDHKLYAIAANPDVNSLPLQPDSSGQNVRVNNQVLWTFEGGAGFETNPLVVGGTVYAGNRDGYLYALDKTNGSQRWKFATDAPILYSAAASSDGSKIYFASNDMYAYAVDATTGVQVWKSAKLLGTGFDSWWPVVYRDQQTQKEYVLLSGSHAYRLNTPPGINGFNRSIQFLDREVFLGANNYGDTGGTAGALIGVRNSNGSIDTSVRNPSAAMSAGSYYQNKPWRRTYFVLDAGTGQEQSPYAPFLWLGSASGNRFPSVIGADNRIYQSAGVYYRDYIDAAGILSWKPGSPNVTTPESELMIVDEPIYYASGGNIIYWSRQNDTGAGAFDISVPNTNYGTISATREWKYWDYNGPQSLFPNYDAGSKPWQFGGIDGSYGRNGNGNPPIPYNGLVFVLKGNSLLALGMTSRTTGAQIAAARVVPVTAVPAVVDVNALKAKLNTEIQKMVAAGHLRPGYFSSGSIDGDAYKTCGDVLLDYFHNPADTLWALSAAMPYLDPAVAQSAKTYLQSEYAAYNPTSITHVGWRDGASRDWHDLPPEVEADRANYLPTQWLSNEFTGWGQKYGGTNIPPYAFYTMWKYAQAVGLSSAQVQSMLNATRSQLDTSPPSASVLAMFPFVHNAYIAGYQGYLGLEALAGETQSASIQSTLSSLLASRAANFTASAGNYPADYCNAFNTSRNWMWMTPELAQYLHDNALTKVQAAVDEYQRITPYWFVAGFPDTINESIHQPMYDVLMLQAKAFALKQPASELVKYLDVPAFARGDLFYIQNLTAVIAAQSNP